MEDTLQQSASFQLQIYSCDSLKDGLSTLSDLGIDLVYTATMTGYKDCDDDAATTANNAMRKNNSIPGHQVAPWVIGLEGNRLIS
jgi:hypothetical protein